MHRKHLHIPQASHCKNSFSVSKSDGFDPTYTACLRNSQRRNLVCLPICGCDAFRGSDYLFGTNVEENLMVSLDAREMIHAHLDVTCELVDT